MTRRKPAGTKNLTAVIRRGVLKSVVAPLQRRTLSLEYVKTQRALFALNALSEDCHTKRSFSSEGVQNPCGW